MKITETILSIPPYISTTWSQVAAFHMKGSLLSITLVDGDTLHIPNLTTETINTIFQYHAIYLESHQITPPSPTQHLSPLKGLIDQEEPALRVAFGPLDTMGGIMQHNSSQSNAPDLPPEILQKIGAIAKIVSAGDEMALPKAEVNCNCFFCQIARTVNPQPFDEIEGVKEEPEVHDEDLQFQQWSINQTGDQLFSVVNRLDEFEKYSVFLGQPVGCTCGKTGCEHILAVLKS